MTRPRKRRTTPSPAAPRARSRVAWLLIGAAAVVAIAWYWSVRRPATFVITRTEDQNVLLITIDTLRADALGSYGGAARRRTRSPGGGRRPLHLRPRARVVTLPSHANILTGLYPFQHGVRDNSGFRFPARRCPRWRRVLKARGFATGAFVGAFPLDSQFGLDARLRRLRRYTSTRATLPRRFRDFRSGRRRRSSPRARPGSGGSSGRCFAWVHVFDPHAPYDRRSRSRRATRATLRRRGGRRRRASRRCSPLCAAGRTGRRWSS